VHYVARWRHRLAGVPDWQASPQADVPENRHNGKAKGAQSNDWAPSAGFLEVSQVSQVELDHLWV